MPLPSKALAPLERAYLGEVPLWATSVFWQCAVALVYPLFYICLAAVQLHSRKPELFSRLWFVFPILVGVLIYLTWRFLGKAAKLRLRLREAQGTPQYDDCLWSAKSLTSMFVRTAFIFGIAVIILLMILEW
jgi:hypothetical protein